MNSLERKELKYQRRKKKREDKLITNSNKYADVNNCFVFSKVYDYAKKCTRNVGYKKSTIYSFSLHLGRASVPVLATSTMLTEANISINSLIFSGTSQIWMII